MAGSLYLYPDPASTKVIIVIAEGKQKAVNLLSKKIQDLDETKVINFSDTLIIQTGKISCHICNDGWGGHCDCNTKISYTGN